MALVKMSMKQNESAAQLRFDKAEVTFSEAKKLFEDLYQPNHYRTGEFFMEYGKLQMLKQDFETAFPLLKRSDSILRENYDDGQPKITAIRSYLKECNEKMNL